MTDTVESGGTVATDLEAATILKLATTKGVGDQVCALRAYSAVVAAAAREAAEKGAAALRGAVERLALKLCRSVEQYDAAGRHAKSDFRDGLHEAESNAAAALAAVLRDTRPTSDNDALCNPEPTP